MDMPFLVLMALAPLPAPPELPTPVLDGDAIDAANAELAEAEAETIIAWAAETFGDGLVMSSSFGAHSAVMLHLVHRVAPRTKVVFVDTGRGPERRPVETGEFNNEYIEIAGGLEEGEQVFLRRPEEFQFEEDDIIDDSDAMPIEAGIAEEWGATQS